MARYFFDIQSDQDYFLDEEGVDLPDRKAAEIEAMQTLIGMVRDSAYIRGRPDVAIEVRSTTERLFCASIVSRIAGSMH
jgi:hypothetical protein